MTPMPFAAPIARALLRSQSDERLVGLAKDGHAGAFDEIVRRYRTPLVAFAASYAPTEGAEDVVQESFANAWISLQSSDREIALKPWLYAIVRNRSLNAKRDAKHHDELDETIDGVRRPDEIFLQRDELRRAVAAVVALPDSQRKALVDSAIEGRTHDQIAAELGTTADSVRGLIHRGRVTAKGALGSAVPFPLVAWAAGSGGAAAGGAAAGTVVGGSLAAKGAAVVTIAVLATGSGFVVERSLDDSAKSDREASAADVGRSERNSKGPGEDSPGGPGSPDNPGRNDDARGDDDPGDDEGDDNSGSEGDRSGSERGEADTFETPETPETAETPETPETPDFHDNSGSGSDSSGSGSSGPGSGSGSSGSGSSGSGLSGSGSGSSGSGLSGSGSGDDSSGSGSGGDDDPDD